MALKDTDPNVERIWIDMVHAAPPWRKMRMVGEMNRTVRLLMLTGLRQRYPRASEKELRRRLAGLLLGEELATKAYGPLPRGDSPDE